jgi:hypothetical protein
VSDVIERGWPFGTEVPGAGGQESVVLQWPTLYLWLE